MKKIGVITWHTGPNYGSALQSYALQHAISALGYESYLIDFQGSTNGINTIFYQIIKRILCYFSRRFRIKYFYNQNKFVRDYNRLTSFCYDDKSLKKATDFLDIIVCGSDQIWAPNLYDERYMASFANKTQRKVSYAASIGLNEIPKELVQKYKIHLSSFYAIGVREEKAKELLHDECGISSQVVLDPTLLLNESEYRKIEKEVKQISKPFVFCYFLKTDNQYKESVMNFAEERNLQIVGISFKKSDGEWMQNLEGQAADSFLWLIDNAEYVFTDSYHCTIFSLLFHKKFFVLQRFNNDDLLCQNSRLVQLDAYFGIKNRFVSNGALVNDFDIDYKYIDARLNDLQSDSMRFLTNALK